MEECFIELLEIVFSRLFVAREEADETLNHRIRIGCVLVLVAGGKIRNLPTVEPSRVIFPLIDLGLDFLSHVRSSCLQKVWECYRLSAR